MQKLRDRLGSSIQPKVQSVSGGCLHSTYQVLVGQDQFFLKTGSRNLYEVFRGEAEGLSALSRAKAFRIPEMIDCNRDEVSAWLLLEWLDLGGRLDMEEAGRRLALQHSFQGNVFGYSSDNHIGATPQINTLESDWIAFFGRHRLGAMGWRCKARGMEFAELEELIEMLPDFFGDRTVPPSLLHGDLWSGNLAALKDGDMAVYDPAVHYGDPECDLAMTELFGGFAPAFYEAYYECFPMDDDYGQRKGLYQLYHIMNHALLFGGAYVPQAQGMIRSLLTMAR